MPLKTPPAISATTPGQSAAMYVRMSTSLQDRSIEHQCERLQQYADEHGIEVVKMYADAGKSGLCINGRDGLQALMADVQAGNTAFTMVLVYDVSRWGRFQDTDEGAHYEYLCRQAGIQVIYCAEQFANDGSAIASILKGMKRTMAAEYSRELSAKVFAAQCRFAAQGFKMGGFAGYGLRRVSYNSDGLKRRVLQAGERKAAATDRVRFCWGPKHEVETVRRIYGWYVQGKLGDTEIAAKLNAQKVRTEWGRPWTAPMVKSILTNEKYIGRVVFNRGSAKMNMPRISNPERAWVCMEAAFPAIVAPALFKEAIAERQRRNRPKTRAELVGMLRALHAAHGKITGALINAALGIPGQKYFIAQFGTLAEAYAAAGLPSAEPLLRARTLRSVRQLQAATMASIELGIEQAGGTHAPCGHPSMWRINDSVDVKLVVARSRHDDAGRIRWRIPIHTAPNADFIICVQMDAANVGVMAYYLFPATEFTQAHIILRAEWPDDRGHYRHITLSSVFGLFD